MPNFLPNVLTLNEISTGPFSNVLSGIDWGTNSVIIGSGTAARTSWVTLGGGALSSLST